MTKTILSVAFVALVATGPAFAEDPVPCEDLAKQVNDALKTATLSDADKAKVKKHRKAGLDLCKAEKDADADAEFTAALKLMGK
jgi:hypothetical protein